MDEKDILRIINKKKSLNIIVYIIIAMIISFFVGRLSAVTKKEIIDFSDVISKHYKIPKYIIPAIIQAESSFNINAVSEKEAYGLMQVTLKAYTDYTNLVENYRVESFECVKTNWVCNIAVGSWYLKKRCYSGDWKTAITKYFWGISHTNTTDRYYTKVSKHF